VFVYCVGFGGFVLCVNGSVNVNVSVSDDDKLFCVF